jgi:hypothetical protein
MNLEELKKEIAKIIGNTLVKMYHGKISPLTVSNLILSIKIGGEVVEECPVCKKFPIDRKVFPDKIHNRLGIHCNYTGKITRPRLLRDCLGKEER